MTAVLKDVSHQDPETFYKEMELEVLARTIYGEAQEYDPDVKESIASVIINRAATSDERGGYWWGNNILQICQKPYQFSCWNRSHPKFKRLSRVSKSDYVFNYCWGLAKEAIDGKVLDKTLGSTHYHHIFSSPYWANRENPVVVVEPLAFYKLV